MREIAKKLRNLGPGIMGGSIDPFTAGGILTELADQIEAISTPAVTAPASSEPVPAVDPAQGIQREITTPRKRKKKSTED